MMMLMGNLNGYDNSGKYNLGVVVNDFVHQQSQSK